MMEIFKTEYFSKADNFIFPLTNLKKKDLHESYLFWDRYSIKNYQLILKFDWDNREEFEDYCRNEIFPVLQSNLLEIFDFQGFSLFIVDLSEWALDIDLFLKGKYSKLSGEAKECIKNFHLLKNKATLPAHIFYTLSPTEKNGQLGGKTALEYVSDQYGIDYATLAEVGEVGSVFSKELETFVIPDVLV